MKAYESKEISLDNRTYSFRCHPGSQFEDIVCRWQDDLWVFYNVSDDTKEWQTKGKVVDAGRCDNASADEWIASLEAAITREKQDFLPGVV